MEVILVKPVKKLGSIGSLVKVKDGFARNFLIPRNFAVKANEKNLLLIKEQEKALRDQNEKAKADANKLGEKIRLKEITLIRQASADGKLFGSISRRDISSELSSISKTPLHHSHISMDDPIKAIGIYEVEVALHPEVTEKIIVNISRTDTEAVEALMSYKRGSLPKEEQQGTEAAKAD